MNPLWIAVGLLAANAALIALAVVKLFSISRQLVALDLVEDRLQDVQISAASIVGRLVSVELAVERLDQRPSADVIPLRGGRRRGDQ